MYNIDIDEAPEKDGHFLAALRGEAVSIHSRDPEHDICLAIAEAGLPDGAVQFWRDDCPTLWHPSAYRLGKLRIELGESFPRRRVKRRAASDGLKTLRGVIAGGQES